LPPHSKHVGRSALGKAWLSVAAIRAARDASRANGPENECHVRGPANQTALYDIEIAHLPPLGVQGMAGVIPTSLNVYFRTSMQRAGAARPKHHQYQYDKFYMVGGDGLEPPTFCV
jgi:hypothetical protein